VAETIKTAAHTDHLGDGKIVVVQVDEVVRIRTGERVDGEVDGELDGHTGRARSAAARHA
jgi:hypothetical protein